VLRGFDQQMANLVAEEMEQRGVHFIYQAKPKKVAKQEDGRLLIDWVDKVCVCVCVCVCLCKFTEIYIKETEQISFFALTCNIICIFLGWSNSSRRV